MKPRLFAALILLAAAALACQVPALGGGQSGSQPDERLLFQDDFSNPESGWRRVSVDSGQTDYIDGAYRIFVNSANTDIWAYPGLSFGDVQVEVVAAKSAGPDDNDFGLICRMVSNDQFYFFLISSDGYYGIGKRQGADQGLINMEAMQPNEDILQGGASNRLRADCIGDTLTLYVNGKKVATAQDTDFQSGDVGLIAGSFETPGTDIRFDDFKVLKPEGSTSGGS